MEDLILAVQSVGADVSEFIRAEREAFVGMNRRIRPASWALVERLQQACWAESPATAAGKQQSVQTLRGYSPEGSAAFVCQ